MVRTVLTPKSQTIHFEIPENYVGKKIEIIAFTLDEEQQEKPPITINTMAQFWGTMSNETADDLNEQIKIGRNEWDRNI